MSYYTASGKPPGQWAGKGAAALRLDEKWRTLDSRSLHKQKLAVAPVTDRMVETRLSALGYAMVPRADGNGGGSASRSWTCSHPGPGR